MKRIIIGLGAIAASTIGASEGSPLILHPLMKDSIAPAAQSLWDVGNRAMDDNGNPDASKLTPADWQTLAAAAGKMREAASALATAQTIAVTGPNMKLQDEGAPTASTPAQIQHFIDGDRKGFADHAHKLAAIADDIVRAAKTRDGATLGEATGRLDEVCEACHTLFWYPNQAH